jgi:hypothetical protein
MDENHQPGIPVQTIATTNAAVTKSTLPPTTILFTASRLTIEFQCRTKGGNCSLVTREKNLCVRKLASRRGTPTKAATSVYCMMRSLILFLLINLSCMKSDHQYVYADGSANRYIITADSLEYDPVTPEESATGTYSGGDPKIVSISAEQFESISQLFDKAIANKAVHIEDRIKTSGAISVLKGDTSTQVILAPGCAEKEAIESLLKQILSR